MFKKNLIANYVGQGWVAVVGLVFIPVYVNRLGVEAYGLIGFYVVLQSWLAVLDLGITPTMTREAARFSQGEEALGKFAELFRSVELLVFAIAVSIAIAIWLFSEAIANFWLRTSALPVDRIAQVIAIMAFVVALRFCEGIYRGVLYGRERLLLYNSVYAVLSTIRYGGAAIAVTAIPTIEVFFLWQAAVAVLSVAVLRWVAYRALSRTASPVGFSLDALLRVHRFAGGMSITAVLGLVFTQLDKLILTRLVDLDVFGVYMLATAVAGILPVLASPSASAYFPRLSRAVAERDSMAERRLFFSGVQVVSIFSAPVLAVCVLLGYELIFAWTGDRDVAADVALVLGFIAAGTYCNAVMQIPFMLQLAHGWTTLSVRVNLLGIIVLVPMVYFGVQFYGALGAAAAWAVANLLVLVLAVAIMHQRLLRGGAGSFFSKGIAYPLLVSGAVSYAVSLVSDIDQGRSIAFVIVVLGGGGAMLATMIALPLSRGVLRHYFHRVLALI